MNIAFLHGFLLAFGLILPLGVQNLFVFTQGAIQPSLLKVVPVVLVAALCDTLLITLAVGGISVAVLTLASVKTVLVIGGSVFLVYVGWLTWQTADARIENTDSSEWTLKRRVVFAASVSLLNPHAILDTVGVIGTSSLAYSGSDKFAFTAACIGVSWLWFSFLAVAGRLAGSLDKTGALLSLVNRLSAIIMGLSAVYLIKTLL